MKELETSIDFIGFRREGALDVAMGHNSCSSPGRAAFPHFRKHP